MTNPFIKKSESGVFVKISLPSDNTFKVKELLGINPNIARKSVYNRINAMIKAGCIKRASTGKYVITDRRVAAMMCNKMSTSIEIDKIALYRTLSWLSWFGIAAVITYILIRLTWTTF